MRSFSKRKEKCSSRLTCWRNTPHHSMKCGITYHGCFSTNRSAGPLPTSFSRLHNFSTTVMNTLCNLSASARSSIEVLISPRADTMTRHCLAASLRNHALQSQPSILKVGSAFMRTRPVSSQNKLSTPLKNCSQIYRTV